MRHIGNTTNCVTQPRTTVRDLLIEIKGNFTLIDGNYYATISNFSQHKLVDHAECPYTVYIIQFHQVKSFYGD